jgi:hypothetical protein
MSSWQSNYFGSRYEELHEENPVIDKQTETVSHDMKEKVSTTKTNEGAIATSTSLVVFMGLNYSRLDREKLHEENPVVEKKNGSS